LVFLDFAMRAAHGFQDSAGDLRRPRPAARSSRVLMDVAHFVAASAAYGLAHKHDKRRILYTMIAVTTSSYENLETLQSRKSMFAHCPGSDRTAAAFGSTLRRFRPFDYSPFVLDLTSNVALSSGGSESVLPHRNGRCGAREA